MKSLIIGANGLVGSALGRAIPDAYKASHVPTKGRLYVDILKYETIEKVFSSIRPDIVYLPAGFTNVDACEDLETNAINIRGPVNVLRLCEKYKIKLVWFSTSYVFDGKSEVPYTLDDEVNPINNYGKQKNTVENLIITSNCNHLIVRTVGVFGTETLKKNFAKSVIGAIFKGKHITVPNDQWMNPIWSDDLANIVSRIVSNMDYYSGIIHVAGNTCITKYDWALRIADEFGLGGNVYSKSTEEMKQKAQRPLMGCLDCHELEVLGITIPSLASGFAHFLEHEIV